MSGTARPSVDNHAPGASGAGGGEVEGLADLFLDSEHPLPRQKVRGPGGKTRTARVGGVSVDLTRVPKLVNRLLAAAREEDALVEELCGAVLRADWGVASRAVAAIARHRGDAAAKTSAGMDTAGG